MTGFQIDRIVIFLLDYNVLVLWMKNWFADDIVMIYFYGNGMFILLIVNMVYFLWFPLFLMQQ